VIAHDPVLETRDAVLDPRVVAERLAAPLGRAVEGCELVRVTYRFGASLRVLYRLGTGPSTLLVAGRTFAIGRSVPHFGRALDAAGSDDRLLHDASLSTVFWVFPSDRKLRTLGTLLRAERWRGARLVAYVPEKAATFALAAQRAYVKVYADDTAARTAAVHRALERAPGVSVPPLVAHLPAQRALVVGAVGGRRLADVEGDDRLDGYARFGAALARLHRLDPVDRQRVARLDPPAVLHAGAVLARARPDLTEALAAVTDALRRGPSATGARDVCAHGDAHPKNVILAGDGAALIDLDQVAAAAADAEIGSVLAGLRYERLVGELDTEAERRLADSFLGGYAAHAEPPAEAARRRHVAAALVAERALRAVTRMRTAGLARLDAIVADAAEAVA
jgi:tRNA A-37 threonylcarbamoyl transferase component Bud32